jgi:heme a synthase
LALTEDTAGTYTGGPSPAGDKWVAAWLFFVAALVATMILVGGATRLTDSGLSIVEWRPVTGAIPPTSEAAWQEELSKYRSTTEYQQQNRGMTLEEFKVIYWWEWGHRQLGRVVGLVFAVGLLFFGLAGRLKGRLAETISLFLLGGLQGAIGWWMVSSGLVGRLDVAPYRLATHLGMAFIIIALSWRLAFLFLRPTANYKGSLRGTILAVLVFFQIILGALVAGNDAGRTYVDWPTMGGEWFPSSYFDLSPLWTNIVSNIAAVQFNHRVGGYLVFVACLVVAWRLDAQRTPRARRLALWLAGGAVFQLVVGIITLMNAAPWHLGLLHQGGAIVLWLAAVHTALFGGAVSKYRIPESIPDKPSATVA